jgi:Tfp pilus assembly protein PilZ
MEYRSDLVSSAGGAAAATAVAPYRKRRHFRQKIQSLAYVNLDQANGGIVRDLSEAGVAIQAVAPLRVNQQVYLRFELLSPRVRVEAAGRVAWADAMGQAGVEFVSIPQRSRSQLKEWLFTQLLTTAHQVVWDSVFLHSKGGADATELLFSAAPRPVIRLEPEATIPPNLSREEVEDREYPQGPEDGPEPLHLLGFPISTRAFARLVDGLVLMSAVLLFSLVSVAMTHIFPRWPVALGLALSAACVFGAVYWFLFVVWIGATPGTRLAQHAATDSDDMYLEEEDRPRFR